MDKTLGFFFPLEHAEITKKKKLKFPKRRKNITTKVVKDTSLINDY